MKNQTDQIIFLVGCSRSGTTLLQSILATHPEIASFPETKFFHYIFPSPYERRRYALRLVSRRLKPRLETLFRDELERPELIYRLPQIPTIGYYTRKFMGILKSLAEEQGKKIILEKTPDHIYYLDDIQKLVPNAKFIHLLRNGTDVIASLYEVTHQYPQAWGGARNIDVCINDWLTAIQASQKYMNCPNHVLVRYEDFIQNPILVVKKICEFININFYETMLNNYSEAANLVSLEEEGRSVISNRVLNTKSHKFSSTFTPIQQNYILDKLSTISLDNNFNYL